MERTVLDVFHAATASSGYSVSYVPSTHNSITSAAGITEGSLWDAPPTLIINTFKHTDQIWHGRSYLEEFLELTKNYHLGFCNSQILNCKCSTYHFVSSWSPVQTQSIISSLKVTDIPPIRVNELMIWVNEWAYRHSPNTQLHPNYNQRMNLISVLSSHL